MLMLKKTHVAAMDIAEYAHQRTKDILIKKHAEIDRLRTETRSLHALNVVLAERNRIMCIERSAALAEAESIKASLDVTVPPFKWGAEPAPEAKRAHLVDRAMQVESPFRVRACPPFSDLDPMFLDSQLMGRGFYPEHDKRPYVDRQWRAPYAGTAAPGRMPGAGSVSFPNTAKE